MNKVYAALILFLILFIIIFLVDFLIIKGNYEKKSEKKKKKGKNYEVTEIEYLINKFNLDKKKLPIKKIIFLSSCINAFIISLVGVVVILIDVHPIVQLLIGFILLISLIYSLYELLGRYLIKKGCVKNGK